MAEPRRSAVTPERFAAGLTWDEYFGRIQRNREKFEQNYRATRLTPRDIAAFRALTARDGGPAKVLALVEDWCPDTYRGLPVMARIAEAAGMDLRIFPRDENLDVMSEFLNQGEWQSIPTFVFYTRDHRYIAHWSERPAKATAEMGELRRRVEGREPEEARALWEEFHRGPVWASWRDETVREIRELLENR